MKVRSIFACAAAGIAMTAIGMGTASAEGVNGTLQIVPTLARAGQSVTLNATCDADTFSGAESYVFESATEFSGDRDDAGVFHLTATAKIKSDAAAGAHTALFACGDETFTGSFTIETIVNPELHVNPTKGLPGAKTEILMLCGSPTGEVKATSPALKVGKLEAVPQKPGDVVPWVRATATVQDVKPGTYPITMKCGGAEFTTKATFTVLAKDAPAPAPKNKAQIPVKPKGAADTGSLDNPAKTAAPAEENGPNALVLGGAALAALAAGGLGLYAYRRRQHA